MGSGGQGALLYDANAFRSQLCCDVVYAADVLCMDRYGALAGTLAFGTTNLALDPIHHVRTVMLATGGKLGQPSQIVLASLQGLENAFFDD